MQSELKFRFIPTLIILAILLFSHLHSTAQDDDPGKKAKKNWPAIIHKITDLGLPQDMVYRIRRMNKAEMDSIHGEDYHENLREGDDEYVLKVMLRFVDGRIIGFVKKEPMMQSNQGTYLSEVDIPVEWCGMDSLKTEHCVKSEEEMALLDSGVVIKPRDWHQKLDANEISTDVVANNVDLLKLLENKATRKKLQSKKMTDSLSHVLQKLTGDDSAYVAKQLDLVTKEYKEAQRRKQGGDFIDDSTLSVITNGLTGADSLKAIKSYLATKKAEKSLKGDKKYQKGVAALDSTTIASITKGLTGADSINALKNYLEPKIVKADKKKSGEQLLDSATIASVTKGLSGADSVNAIRSYIMAEKASRTVKEKDSKKIKKEEQLLDSATIASVTQGLTGSDCVNEIRSYVMAAKSKPGKKNKKGSAVVPSITNENIPANNATDSTSAIPTPTVVATKPTKADKKKKKTVEPVVIPPVADSAIAMATKGLSGADSINAIRELKLEEKRNKNNKKNKKAEQVTALVDSSLTPVTKTEEAPTPPPVVNKKDRKKKKGNQPAEQVVADTAITTQPTPIIANKQEGDTLKSTLPTATKDSTTVVQPVVPPVETKKERRRKKGNQPTEQVVTDTATTSSPTPIIANKQEGDTLKSTLPTATKDSTTVVQPVVPPPVEKKPFRKRLKVVAPPTDDSTATHNPITDSTGTKLPVTDSTKTNK